MARPFATAATVLFLLLTLAHSGLRAGDRPVVVVSTTMISSMINHLAPESIEARTIIPASACPGTYDLRPSDAARLARADLIVRHDFQAYLDARLRAQNPDLPVQVLKTPGGSLVIPENYLIALRQLRDILAARFPNISPALNESYASAEVEVRAVEREARGIITDSGLKGNTVLCADKQAAFVRWAGLNVASVFTSSPDELSALHLGRTISAGRKNGARFVAGNQHSGGEAVARAVANETDLPVAILSNFPGSNKRNGTWRELLLDNLDLLAQAAGVKAQP